jgi:two-component system sensor histidine kinase RegB
MATLSLLMSELESRTDKPELRELMQQATQQLGHCRKMLGALLSYGRNSFDSRTEVGPVEAFLGTCIENFRQRRPGVAVTLAVDGPGPSPAIRHDLGLRQGVLNLLGNAADVSPQWIEVHTGWDDEHVTIVVRDRGPGIPPGAEKQIGKLFYTTKPAGEGNGLGLSLAHTAVSRLGGALEVCNAPEGGACAKITLPVEPPEPSAAPVPLRAGRA